MYSFDEKTPTILCEIMQKYGSDKGGKNIRKLIIIIQHFTIAYLRILEIDTLDYLNLV